MSATNRTCQLYQSFREVLNRKQNSFCLDHLLVLYDHCLYNTFLTWPFTELPSSTRHESLCSACESHSPTHHSHLGCSHSRAHYIPHIKQWRTIPMEQNETSRNSISPSLPSPYPPQPHKFRLHWVGTDPNWGASRHQVYNTAQQGSSYLQCKVAKFRYESATALKGARVPILPADCTCIW